MDPTHRQLPPDSRERLLLGATGDLPAGDRTAPDTSGFVLGDEVFDLRNQTIVLVNPPDLDVGINNDHRAASQSPSVTLP